MKKYVFIASQGIHGVLQICCKFVANSFQARQLGKVVLSLRVCSWIWYDVDLL